MNRDLKEESSSNRSKHKIFKPPGAIGKDGGETSIQPRQAICRGRKEISPTIKPNPEKRKDMVQEFRCEIGKRYISSPITSQIQRTHSTQR